MILKDRVVKIHAVQMVVAVMVAKLEIAAKVVAVTDVAVIQKIVAKRDKLISKIVCNLKFIENPFSFKLYTIIFPNSLGLHPDSKYPNKRKYNKRIIYKIKI